MIRSNWLFTKSILSIHMYYSFFKMTSKLLRQIFTTYKPNSLINRTVNKFFGVLRKITETKHCDPRKTVILWPNLPGTSEGFL